MRKLALWVVGALILLFTVDGALAQEPNQRAEPNRQAGDVDTTTGTAPPTGQRANAPTGFAASRR